MSDLSPHHERIRQRRVNSVLYWVVRAVLQPFFHLYFRLRREGHSHVPDRGPVILASNHRSFLDPFLIASCARRPIYFLAKRELFDRRVAGRVLNALGAFPVRRDESDAEAIATARVVLDRGDALVMFPEGTRVRHGTLGRPRRGVGRLALETGAPVVPVAVTGSERARRGWLVRPCRVSVRCGRPLTFPRVESPSPRLAREVTARIWPCVELQWEWLGGLPPLRRAAVIGAGPMGRALARVLARADIEVELGCRTEALAAALAGERELAEPTRVKPVSVAALDVAGADLVVLAVPARGLPGAMAELGDRIGRDAGVLVLSKGLVGPLGTTPTRYVAERLGGRAVAWLGGPSHADEMVASGATVVVASTDADLSQRVAAALTTAGLAAERTGDVVGAELAGCAKNVAALAAAAAAPAGLNVAGAAAGRVFGEVHALALERGASARTFAGLAGAGDLVATALAAGSRNRRAGELLGSGVPRERIAAMLGATAEALDTAPLLADVLARRGAAASASTGLADLVEGRMSPEEWVSTVRPETAVASRRAA